MSVKTLFLVRYATHNALEKNGLTSTYFSNLQVFITMQFCIFYLQTCKRDNSLKHEAHALL
jgi:hypothetical protein